MSVVKKDKMTDIEEVKIKLQKIGLSKNQAEIYLLLVNHKELRIQEIVKLSRIPRTTVYECLQGLFNLGIAEEIIEENFKKIRPYSIGAIKHGLDEKILQLQKLTNDLDELEKKIPLIYEPGTNGSTVVRYYKGRSGAQQLYWNTFQTKNTLDVYSDWGRERYVGRKFYERFVDESRVRGIKERVLINFSPETLESIRKFSYPQSPISRTRIEDIRVVDEKKILINGDTLIYDNIFAQVYLKSIEINGFEVENEHFANFQRSIYEMLWADAKPVVEFL